MPRVRVLFLYPLHAEDVQRVRIRAGEHRCAVRLTGDAAAIAEDVRIQERNMHRHRAELTALGVKIPRIADFMPMMAGAALDYHIKCNTAPKKERHCVRFVLE